MPCLLFVVNFISCVASAEDRRLLFDFPQDRQYLDLVVSLAATAMGMAEDVAVPSLSIAGSQGTGKSTLAQALQSFLRARYGKHAVIFSLDDFYLTSADRQHRYRRRRDTGRSSRLSPASHSQNRGAIPPRRPNRKRTRTRKRKRTRTRTRIADTMA